MIDHRAVIDPTAKIADKVEIGPYAIVGANVEIAEGTSIGPHAMITGSTKIGRNNKIYAYAAIGGDPQHTEYKGETTYLEIGDDNIIREFCTFHRGTPQGKGITRIGNRNYFMAYAHVAHDCVVGNDNILANNASIAGHVIVEDFVVFGAFCGVHQHVKISSHCFLGRATKVGQDIPPYLLVTGIPGGPNGLNLIGLKRRGFSKQTLSTLRQAYSIVYRQGLSLKEAISRLEEMAKDCVELQAFVDAIKNSKRGISRKINDVVSA